MNTYEYMEKDQTYTRTIFVTIIMGHYHLGACEIRVVYVTAS